MLDENLLHTHPVVCEQRSVFLQRPCNKIKVNATEADRTAAAALNLVYIRAMSALIYCIWVMSEVLDKDFSFKINVNPL